MGGRVVVQTRQPAHPAVACAAWYDVEGFVRTELAERADPPYPPHTHLANVVVSGTNERRVAESAASLTAWIQALFRARSKAALNCFSASSGCPLLRSAAPRDCLTG